VQSGHRAMCWSPLAHAQQLPSIESLSESYVACVQSALCGASMIRCEQFATKRPNERFLMSA